jgi:hypothetical protein
MLLLAALIAVDQTPRSSLTDIAAARLASEAVRQEQIDVPRQAWSAYHQWSSRPTSAGRHACRSCLRAWKSQRSRITIRRAQSAPEHGRDGGQLFRPRVVTGRTPIAFSEGAVVTIADSD